MTFDDVMRLQRVLGYSYHVHGRSLDPDAHDRDRFDSLEVTSDLWEDHPRTVLITANAGGRFLMEIDISQWIESRHIKLAPTDSDEPIGLAPTDTDEPLGSDLIAVDPDDLLSAVGRGRFQLDNNPQTCFVWMCVTTGVEFSQYTLADFRRFSEIVRKFRADVSGQLPGWVKDCAN